MSFQLPTFRTRCMTRHSQHGGAMLVMLVVVIIGFTTALVASLGSNAYSKRNQTTIDALAQAKEALIGYAVSDDNRPGELPCPDTNDDGSAETLSGNDCAGGNFGRLPWKTLGLPDLRDAAGEHLWYAVSDPFHAGDNAVLNSDTTGTLDLSGNITASNLIAIVFAPGSPLSSQSRIAANVNTYSHYLESVVTSPTSFQQLPPNDLDGGAYTYNDQMVYISYEHLMPLVEKRIAREAKSCLDQYALSNTDRNYPWPAKISFNNYTSYYNASYILFGRLPIRPNVFTTDPTGQKFIDYLTALQRALNDYAASNTAATRAALDQAGDNLENFADGVGSPISGGTADDGESAGDRAQDLADTPPTSTVGSVQSKINETIDGLISDGLISHASTAPDSMPTYWPNCPMLATLNTSTHTYEPADYWDDWKSLLFYEVANNCRPYWGTCSVSGGSLSITGSAHTNAGSGTYRAAVVLARKKIQPGQAGRTLTSTSTNLFLESNNVQTETDTTPNTFLTYKSSDANYSTVNDIVLCLDGGVNCQ